MALETGTYISDLVSTNPVASDNISDGDNHIRLLKSTVKATFPNVSGAVTPTHTELNYVDGVTSPLQTQLDLKAPLASPALTGTATAVNLTASGTLATVDLTASGDATISGDMAVSGSLGVTGDLLVAGNLALGNDAGDSLLVVGTIAAGVSVAGSTSGNALRITQTGSGNALLIEDSTNPDSTPLVVDASGRMIQGHTTALAVEGVTYPSQIIGESTTGELMYRSDTSPTAATLNFAKSRGTVASPAVVVSGDNLGQIDFSGYDGLDFYKAASIIGEVGGQPGSSDMPGRLKFFTTADGASTITERFRIDSDGSFKSHCVDKLMPSYTARAWVNFNGTGTVAIRDSGNVTSVTDLGVGKFRVNIDVDMPDSNYAVSGTMGWSSDSSEYHIVINPYNFAVGSVSFNTSDPTGNDARDPTYASIVIHR